MVSHLELCYQNCLVKTADHSKTHRLRDAHFNKGLNPHQNLEAPDMLTFLSCSHFFSSALKGVSF